MTDQSAVESLTHHVALVLDNDEPLYRHRLELVAMARRSAEAYLADPDNEGSHLTVDKLAASTLSYDLKGWCEGLCELEEMPHGLTSEILTTALAFVDWRSLATSYLDES
jgi:hypothetical protein